MLPSGWVFHAVLDDGQRDGVKAEDVVALAAALPAGAGPLRLVWCVPQRLLGGFTARHFSQTDATASAHRLDYDTWLWEKHGASRSWWQRLTASHPPSRRRAQALAVLCGFARATCAMHCGGPLPPDDHGGRNVEGGAAALESRNDPLWAVRVVNYTGSACSRLKLGKVLGRGEYECSLMTA